MMYRVKQIVGALATPLIAAAVLAAAGAMFLRSRKQARARTAFVAAAAVAYLGALCPVGDALLKPLEERYTPLVDLPPPASVRYIVVLGSGYSPRSAIPVTAALDHDGLARVVEGVRLMKRLPGTQLVLSGGAASADRTPAIGYARLARELGVDDSSLIILTDALDTSGEARSLRATVGQEPFVLVTSASHMPRAMRHMQLVGTQPIAAPTAHRASSGNCGLRTYLPGSNGLYKTELALHEYLGLLALGLGVS